MTATMFPRLEKKQLQERPREEAAVRQLYEQFPYPPRLHWSDEQGRTTRERPRSECQPHVIADEAFGSRPLPRPFRILVAGGGTGDPTLSCCELWGAEYQASTQLNNQS